jgi:mono/diheme cytochrome c family protein
MKRIALSVAVVLSIVLALALIFVYSGSYNVGADEKHWALTERVLQTMRDRSIEAAARGVEIPKLDDSALITKGAEQYSEMCAGCHLSPISRDSTTRKGLYPQPPDFFRQRIEPRRAFWVTKHGLKMSGMPAWGTSHDDAEIWSLVAFLQKLPDLKADEYRAMVAASSKAPSSSSSGGQHSHGK